MEREFDTDAVPPPLASTTVSDDESVTTAVVLVMGSVRDVPPTKLPPLHEVVDPDALDALFARVASPARVTFPYCGHVVSVAADGHVEIYDRAD